MLGIPCYSVQKKEEKKPVAFKEEEERREKKKKKKGMGDLVRFSVVPTWEAECDQMCSLVWFRCRGNFL